MAKQHRVAPDVKEQIINRIKNDGVTVAQASKEHGISENTIYGWIAKNVDGVSYSENCWSPRLLGSGTNHLLQLAQRLFDSTDHGRLPARHRACLKMHSVIDKESSSSIIPEQKGEKGP